MHRRPTIEPLGPHTSLLGESPRWDAGVEELVHVDMLAGEILRVHPDDGAVISQRSVADVVCAVLLDDSDGEIVVTPSGIVRAQPIGGNADDVVELVRILGADGAEVNARLNDAAVDDHGHIWVGETALDGAAGAGALHVWSPRAGARIVARGLTLPNGIGWSPDRTRLYLADSGQRALLVAVHDPLTGDIGPLRVLARFESGEPDGLWIDAVGAIWVAVWDGGRIDRIDPEGRTIGSVSVPVARPTSCVGVPGRGLYVTTARYGLSAHDLDGQPLAGRLLRVDVDLPTSGALR